MEYKLLMSITRPLEESSIGLELELQPVSEELRVPIDSSGGQQDAPAPMSGEVVGSLQDVPIPPDPDPMGPLHSTEVSESITDMNDPASVDQVLSELLTSTKNNVILNAKVCCMLEIMHPLSYLPLLPIAVQSPSLSNTAAT